MQKRNLPYIITYILEILLVLLGAVFYRQPLLSVLLLLLVLLPFLSIFITRREIEKLNVGFISVSHEVIRDGVLNIKITSNYSGLIPLLNCIMDFTFENMFYPHPEPQEFIFPAETRRTGEFTLPFSVTKAGMIKFQVTNINVTDYLHLYTFTKPMPITLEVPVVPKDVPAPYYPKKRVSAAASDGDPSEIYTKGGEKTRDIKQLREYRSGDRLKDIHWKLTAKTDELMVREYEEIKELYYLVIPVLKKQITDTQNDDNRHTNKHNETKELTDPLQETLEIFVAIGKDLIKEREPFSVAIYTSSDNTFAMNIVTEEEELYSALYELYKCPIDGYEDAYEAYKEQFPFGSEGIIIIEDGKVKND